MATGGGGGKISPPPPRVLPECGRQSAVHRGQVEQPEQGGRDNGRLNRAMSKLSSPLTQDVGGDHGVGSPQRQSQSRGRSVEGRPTATVIDTHRAQKDRAEAGHLGGFHTTEAAPERSGIVGRFLQESAKHTTTSGDDDRPCCDPHRQQHHGFLSNRKHYGGRVSPGSGWRRDDSPSSSPVNTMAYHVAGCMCELCRRERCRRVLEPPGQPTFKVVGVEPKLVSATLEAHRFKRHTRGLADRGGQRPAWRVLWSSQHLRY